MMIWSAQRSGGRRHGRRHHGTYYTNDIAGPADHSRLESGRDFFASGLRVFSVSKLLLRTIFNNLILCQGL